MAEETNKTQDAINEAVKDDIGLKLADQSQRPSMSEEGAKAVKDIVDMAELLGDIELSLMGCIKHKDANGQTVYKQVRTPVMNEKGISFFMSELRSACNKNTTLAVTPAWRIPIIVGTKGLLLFKTIAINKMEYGMSDADFAETPARVISAMQVYEMSARHGTEGSEQRNLYGASREMTIHQDSGQQPQQGFLEKIYRAARGQ